jgi:two-component system chemotaxis response regulator CheY
MLSEEEKAVLYDALTEKIETCRRCITDNTGDKDAIKLQQAASEACSALVIKLKLAAEISSELQAPALALALAPAPRPAPAPGPAPGPGFKKPTRFKKKAKKNYRFLIIDDQGVMRALLKSILTDLGYLDIDTAESANKGLTNMSLKDYDAVFCDWEMPGMTGLQLLQKVRSQEQFKDLIFVMITGIDSTSKIRDAIVAGVNDYIVKPVNVHMLAKKLAALTPRD